MQLLCRLKTTAHCNWCSKLIVLILLLLQIHVNSITAERTCHQCRGINCQRTSYEVTEKCTNNLDICVTVFDGQTIQAQGCLEQLSDDLRSKCSSNTEDSDQTAECYKCNKNLCNNLASSSFECVQCDSNTDANCRTNPLSLQTSRCLISRTPNEYCFVKQDGNQVIRGCTSTLEEQKSCLASEGCMICQPSEISSCNSIEVKSDDSGESGSGNGGSGSGSGDGGSGSGSGDGGSGSGSGNGGSGSGSGNGGSGSGSGNEGSGSGSGDGGSGSGSGNGGSGSGSGNGGSGSGSGDGGSGSGSGNGGSESGSGNGGSGSGSGDGGSESGSGDGGSGSGSGGNGINNLNVHIIIFIVYVVFVFSLR